MTPPSPAHEIGEAARLTGLSAKTIRYYEQSGLVREPRRQDNGYRLYDAAALAQLRFVKRARDLGFSLSDVRGLLELWTNRRRSSRAVRALATAHLRSVEAKLKALSELQQELLTLVNRCAGDDHPDCPILDELSSEADAGACCEPPSALARTARARRRTRA